MVTTTLQDQAAMRAGAARWHPSPFSCPHPPGSSSHELPYPLTPRWRDVTCYKLFLTCCYGGGGVGQGLQCAGLCAKPSTQTASFISHSDPVRLREGKEFAQGHTAGKQKSQDLDSSLSNIKVCVLCQPLIVCVLHPGLCPLPPIALPLSISSGTWQSLVNELSGRRNMHDTRR